MYVLSDDGETTTYGGGDERTPSRTPNSALPWSRDSVQKWGDSFSPPQLTIMDFPSQITQNSEGKQPVTAPKPRVVAQMVSPKQNNYTSMQVTPNEFSQQVAEGSPDEMGELIDECCSNVIDQSQQYSSNSDCSGGIMVDSQQQQQQQQNYTKNNGNNIAINDIAAINRQLVAGMVVAGCCCVILVTLLVCLLWQIKNS